MKNQKEIQAKFMKFKSLKEQIDQLNEYIKKTSEKLEQVDVVIRNLDEISKLKKGNEILVPVTSGVFIKAELKDNENFIVNVGADTVIQKNVEGIKELLNEQKKELTEVNMKMMIDLDKTEDKAIALQKELRESME